MAGLKPKTKRMWRRQLELLEKSMTLKRNWHPRAVGKARSYSQSISTCENANSLEKEKAYIKHANHQNQRAT